MHRVVADDRLAVMLAKSLVELEIAVPDDWEKAECDPTSFISLTLERWIKAHGGSAIRRRFLLVAAISDTPCEWAERDESKPSQLFLCPSSGRMADPSGQRRTFFLKTERASCFLTN
jgi:hypothetical protein